MNDPELETLIAQVKTCRQRLERISTQLAAIDAQIYRLLTQPRGSR